MVFPRFLLIILLLILNINALAQLDDKDALHDVKVGKVLFDINIADNPNKLMLYLNVIRKTHIDLVRQNVKSDILLAFRGKAVLAVNTKRTDDMDLALEADLDDLADTVKELQKLGIKMEACGIAMKLFNMQPKDLLPGIKAVGNTFVSITGYHAQGYALIPIY